MTKRGILGLALALLLISVSCVSDGGGDQVAETDFTLQLLHFADIDGNEELALNTVDEFSALVEYFKADSQLGESTLVVSSGDNIIPGSRFYAAEQGAVRAVTGSNEPGHVDVAFLNYLGVQASALGNHDLDAGPGELADALSSEEKNGVVFPGSLFPYLSTNVDWAGDEDTAEILGTDGASVEDLQGKVAKYATVEVAGETLGLIGASTPLLADITSVGGITVMPEDSNDLDALAMKIQESVDALTAQGVDKIILLAHMQQIDIEQALAEKLTGVDIIVAGGSNTRMGDGNDALYPGDDGFDTAYPYQTESASEEPVLVVNVDGDYKYLGRLVVSFDAAGVVIPQSVTEEQSGAWASSQEVVAELGAEPNADLVAVRDAVQEVIKAQFGNVLGFTSVYLDGRRSQVRTQETNLGNLTADANLWYANQLGNEAVDVSMKNGGGLRTEIGSAVVPPGSTDYSEAVYMAPQASADNGTPEGAITEGHLRATLRFDNGLVTMNATAEELVMLLEHGVADSAPGRTPGRFPQIAGMTVEFDINAEAGSRIVALDIVDAQGTVRDSVVAGGEIQGDASRVFRLVTLNFLANGGDSYPYDQLSDPQRRNLYDGTGYGEETDYPDENLAADPGMNDSFSYTGGEQDALSEYLMAFHGSASQAYSMEETDQEMDKRIRY